jgi:hypothetical protein
MRGLVAALGVVLVCATIVVAASVPAWSKETKEFTAGQWGGYVYVDDDTGQFTDCTAWAYNGDNIGVGISVNNSWNLDLWLNGDTWNLPANQSYPISFWIDRNSLYHGKAATYSQKFVKIEVDRGQAVFEELKSGRQLTFRTKSDDYVFGLTGSNAALNQLIDCVDRYSKSASTNPFGDGSSDQQSNAGPATQPEPESGQQQQGAAGGDQSAANTMKLESLTQSVDQVQQFLVEVTGAKPSMITVEPKAFKSGRPYYHFSTPIGEGDFWQEYLGNDSLQSVAVGYLNGYQEDCKGQVERDSKNPIEGEHGQLALGTATCSDSPWQDGSEVLSYAMTASGDVISIYVTYVGGNAAKAKTDSLGKLIARRSEDLIR